MKQLFALFLTLLLTPCTAISGHAQASETNTLIVYFSVPETDKPENMSREEELSTVVIDGKVLGNTQYVAQVIQGHTNGDIFRIEPVTPYPTDHDQLEAVATRERKAKTRPPMATQVEDMGKYQTVFIGYPNWYADMPMILYTFLEQYNLSGKKVIPFVTSGGSGFSRTIQTITDLQPGATVIRDGFSVHRSKVQDAKPDIIEWLTGLGL